MLGDSFVFGQGIARLEDTLPKQLEARLHDAGHPEVEVVNSGVCGLNTFEEYLTYEQQTRRLQPDMVILVWVAFDNMLNGYRESDLAYFQKHRTIPRDGRPEFQTTVDEEPSPWGTPPEWITRSYTATYFGRHLNVLLAPLGLDLNRDVDEQHLHMDSEGYRLMYAALGSLARSCARDAVALHVVIYPGLKALDSDYYQDLIYSKLERRCAKDGISCVNLFPAFRGRDPSDLHVSIIDDHPNAHANAIAADALAAELLARWPAPRRPLPGRGAFRLD
jgi:lysophospholipase L1-like esterase